MPRVTAAAPRMSSETSTDLSRFARSLRTDPSGATSYVLLLGFPLSDQARIPTLVQRGVPFVHLERFQKTIGLSLDQIAALVEIPPRTLTRRRQTGRLRSDESDRLFRAARVVGRILALYDGKLAEACEWLESPQRALGGAVPLTLAATDHGAQAISDIIGRIEYGLGA
jgi:putative toxin-antitoxin system antitoxin component (TIGR02293 family)